MTSSAIDDPSTLEYGSWLSGDALCRCKEYLDTCSPEGNLFATAYVPSYGLDWMTRPADVYLARHNSPLAIRSTGSVVGIHYGADVINGCLYEVTIDFLRWNDGNKLSDFLARLQPKNRGFTDYRFARVEQSVQKVFRGVFDATGGIAPYNLPMPFSEIVPGDVVVVDSLVTQDSMGNVSLKLHRLYLVTKAPRHE